MKGDEFDFIDEDIYTDDEEAEEDLSTAEAGFMLGYREEEE